MRYTNNHNLPSSIVKAITEDSYPDFPKDFKTVPVSTLLRPVKQAILSKRHDDKIVKDISDDIWILLGKSIHYILSQQESKELLIEKRITIPFKEHFISGQPDYYNKETNVLRDFKVTSVWKYVYGPKDGFREWTEQLNMYAWLLRSEGYDVKDIIITAILRDWQARDMKKSLDYPSVQIQDIHIPLWTIQEQESFISEKLELLTSNADKTDDEICICTPEERWATPDTWAVMKAGRKNAVRVLNTEDEAKEIMGDQLPGKPEMWIEKRPGEDKRCMGYCPVSKLCNYWREHEQTRNN